MGYCSAHYQRLRKGCDMGKPVHKKRKKSEECKFSGCKHSVYSKGYCFEHYNQIFTSGNNAICATKNCTGAVFAEGLCEKCLEKKYIKNSKKCATKGCRNRSQVAGFCVECYVKNCLTHGDVCKTEGCNLPTYRQGFCHFCYTKHLNSAKHESKELTASREGRKICSIKRCERIASSMNICNFHLDEIRKIKCYKIIDVALSKAVVSGGRIVAIIGDLMFQFLWPEEKSPVTYLAYDESEKKAEECDLSDFIRHFINGGKNKPPKKSRSKFDQELIARHENNIVLKDGDICEFDNCGEKACKIGYRSGRVVCLKHELQCLLVEKKLTLPKIHLEKT